MVNEKIFVTRTAPLQTSIRPPGGLCKRAGSRAELATFSHAQLLNVAEIARECVASRNTVESYPGILEDLLIATRIPVFRRRAKRAVVAHGKFYFFDCGVFRSLRPAGLLDAGGEIEGAARGGSDSKPAGSGAIA